MPRTAIGNLTTPRIGENIVVLLLAFNKLF